MSIRSKGLVFAMEEAEIENAKGTETEIAEGMSEIDSNEVERQQDEVEIEDLEMAIEEAMDDADTLEDIKDVMEESVETGDGLSPEAAEMAEIAVESICNRLGIRNANIIPAMESFGSSSSRVAATRIAIEGIGEKIKQIWISIKNAVINMFKQIGDFFYKIFGQIPRLQKLINDIDKKVDSLKTDVKISGIFENAGLANALSRSSKLDIKEVYNQFELINYLVDKSLNFQSKLEESLNYVEGLYKDATSNIPWYKFEEKAKAKQNVSKTLFDTIKQDEKIIKNKKGIESGIISLLPNKKLLVVEADSDFNNLKPYIKISVIDDPEAAKETSPAIPTLTKDEMKEIIKRARNLANKLAQFRGKTDPKKTADRFIKLIDMAIKVVDATSKEDTQDYKEKKEYMNAQRRFVTSLSNSSVVIYRRVVGDGVGVCRLGLKYVTESMKQYSNKSSD